MITDREQLKKMRVINAQGNKQALNELINKTQVRCMRANRKPWQQKSMNKENTGN